MKIGSLVEMVKEITDSVLLSPSYPKKVRIPTVANGPYYVDGFCQIGGNNYVYLAGFNDIGVYRNARIAWSVEHFREIEFPPLLQHEISQALTAPLPLAHPPLTSLQSN